MRSKQNLWKSCWISSRSKRICRRQQWGVASFVTCRGIQRRGIPFYLRLMNIIKQHINTKTTPRGKTTSFETRLLICLFTPPTASISHCASTASSHKLAEDTSLSFDYRFFHVMLVPELWGGLTMYYPPCMYRLSTTCHQISSLRYMIVSSTRRVSCLLERWGKGLSSTILHSFIPVDRHLHISGSCD